MAAKPNHVSLSVNNLNLVVGEYTVSEVSFSMFSANNAVTEQDFDLHLRAYLIRQLDFRKGKFMTSNYYGTMMVVGWRIGLTQCRTATEVKHGRARSGIGWVTAQVINQ